MEKKGPGNWTGSDRTKHGKNVPLLTLPFIDAKLIKYLKIENDWIKHTLKVWPAIRKTLGGQ